MECLFRPTLKGEGGSSLMHGAPMPKQEGVPAAHDVAAHRASRKDRSKFPGGAVFLSTSGWRNSAERASLLRLRRLVQPEPIRHIDPRAGSAESYPLSPSWLRPCWPPRASWWSGRHPRMSPRTRRRFRTTVRRANSALDSVYPSNRAIPNECARCAGRTLTGEPRGFVSTASERSVSVWPTAGSSSRR